MPLPTPKEINGYDWYANYSIRTPTFRLTPVEKPDMSPFLIHMTGENAIKSILQCQGASQQINGYGYLQAAIPEYSDLNRRFNSPVVCFSESPTFTLDFFRYRSRRRWEADQSFGIGFDKSTMANMGARPVIYAEGQVVRNIIDLFQQIQESNVVISNNVETNTKVIDIIKLMHPLLYPLLERSPLQGFMWEREWRYPDPNGLIFSHEIIKIICCPRQEEREIREILGDVATRITFVHTWQEYDDVTDYLRRQQVEWDTNRASYEASKETKQVSETKKLLDQLIQKYILAYHSLDSYKNFLSSISNEMEKVTTQQASLDKDIQELRAQKQALETAHPQK